jgi:ethanolamine utilization protein EutP (predicted NTPase)
MIDRKKIMVVGEEGCQKTTDRPSIHPDIISL